MDKFAKPTILVVEDEALTLMTVVGFLEEAGFVCLEAGSVEQARELLNSHPEIVGLFTDIEMPGVGNGLDLACETFCLRPHVRVLIASGRLCPMPSALPPDSVFIAKLYSAETIIEPLQGLLAA